jgi:4-diphosphocytidyl-2-C-methyl-D-erythritol kinase
MKQIRFASSFFISYAKKMSVKTFALPSFAKINWFLRILGKREDGFHELCTVFQTISLHDRLTFSESDRIVLTCDDENIPIDDRNLIVKAAKLLCEKHGIKKGAKIHLEKRIPAPGGLGGGSSNAAIALVGLAKLWELEIDYVKLAETGKKLGSDVPFFFHGGTALGTGRGTEISPLEDLEEKYILIVTPDIAVSSAAAFARINAPHLTNYRSKSILQICRNEALALDLRQTELINDFEKTVFENEFEIRRVKEKLLDYGSVRALMSGSGASVFSIFDTEEKLKSALVKLKSEQEWRVFEVGTISRHEYQTLLGFV